MSAPCFQPAIEPEPTLGGSPFRVTIAGTVSWFTPVPITRFGQLSFGSITPFAPIASDAPWANRTPAVLQARTPRRFPVVRATGRIITQREIDGSLDESPGVERRPGVCGGEPCVVRTRIPIWLLEQARRLGASEADLLRAYPTLRADDLANAWAYVHSHEDEIASQVEANERD